MSPVIFPESESVDVQVQRKCTWVWLSGGVQRIFWFWPWWGRAYRIRQLLLSSHAAICASSHQGNWFEAKFWGLCPIKTLLNIAGHKISSDLEDGAFSVYCSAVKPPAHKTRRLAWVLYSFKEEDNSIRVYWCLLAWPYCSVMAAKQSTLSSCNCCKALHCFACYCISQ